MSFLSLLFTQNKLLVTNLLVLFIAASFSFLLGLILLLLIKYLLQNKAKENTRELVLKHIKHKKPVFFIIFSISLLILISFKALVIPETFAISLSKLLSVILVIFLTWLLVCTTNILEDYLYEKYNTEKQDDFRSRSIATQIRFLKHIVIFVIVLCALIVIALSFKKLKAVGISFLASAGVLGVLVSLSAQKTFNNLLAGIQIAMTQPIKLNDIVIVESEWGRIEEITLTHVIVKIWDLKRLILPITYFVEKPFQNLSRSSTDAIGCVYLYLDFSVPIDELRKKLKEILDDSALWNRDIWGLQVTDTTEKALEIRALMSTSNAENLFDLKCYVREKLVEFIRQEYPEALPKIRGEGLDKLEAEKT